MKHNNIVHIISIILIVWLKAQNAIISTVIISLNELRYHCSINYLNIYNNKTMNKKQKIHWVSNNKKEAIIFMLL